MAPTNSKATQAATALNVSANLARSVVSKWLPPTEELAKVPKPSKPANTSHTGLGAEQEVLKPTSTAEERLKGQLFGKRKHASISADSQEEFAHHRAAKRTQPSDESQDSRTASVKQKPAPAVVAQEKPKKKKKKKKANATNSEPVDEWASNWDGPEEEEEDNTDDKNGDVDALATLEPESRIHVRPLELTDSLVNPDGNEPESDNAASESKKIHTGARPPWAKKKRTRSRQKNLKKDTRPSEQKPTYLTPGAPDYLGPNAPRKAHHRTKES